LRIIGKIQSKDAFALEYEVIPGISSVQALAAKHRIALNRIGESIHITTGRKLAEGFPNNADSVVVLLDGEQSFKMIENTDIDIYWGGYVGTEDEILVSGRLSDVIFALHCNNSMLVCNSLMSRCGSEIPWPWSV
jgi:precorrin-6A synthase